MRSHQADTITNQSADIGQSIKYFWLNKFPVIITDKWVGRLEVDCFPLRLKIITV